MKRCFAILTIVCLVGLSKTAFAQVEGGFVGASLMRSSLSSEVKTTLDGVVISSEPASDSGSGFGIKGGYNFENWRPYALLSKSSYNGFETETFLALANWVHSSGFFIGGDLGLVSMTWTENIASANIKGKSASSIGAVFELGGVYDITDSLRLDIGLPFISAELETKILVIGGGEVVATGTEVQHI